MDLAGGCASLTRALLEFPRSDDPPELESDLEFQVIDWFVPESDKSKQRRDREAGYPRADIPTLPAPYEIFMFGVTADGYSVTVKVNDFVPYFFVKVPTAWKQTHVDNLKELMLTEEVTVRKANGETYVSKIIKKTLQDHLVSMILVKKKDVWGFTNFADFKFIKISVRSLRLYNDLKRYFSEAAQEARGFKLYESNIDPMLRFVHERDIQPCGWVRIPFGFYTQINVEENVAELQTIAEKKLKRLEEDGRIEWEPASTPCHARSNYCVETTFKQVHGLSYNKIAPLLVASFDLECTSSHGDFPVANKNYRKLTIDLIALMRTNPAITTQEIINLIAAAFKPPSAAAPAPSPINRLYPKDRTGVTRASIRTRMQPIIDRLLLMVKSTIKGNDKKRSAAVESDGDESDNDSDNGVSTDMEITQLLDNTLPTLAGDPIIQIGTTVHIYGSDKIVYKHIASFKSCQDIEGAEVEAFNTEAEAIMAWKEIITRLDPDILIGYNIFGFDMKYLADRARELDIYDDFVFNFGRLLNRHSDLEERKLSSSALGDNVMYCFDFDGMVQIDLLKVMQRDHKLDSYKLDSVASKFIVWPATVLSISLCQFKTNTDGVEVGNYVNINGKKVQVAAICQDSQVMTLEGTIDSIAEGEKVTWGLAKDDITPNEIFAKFGGNSHDRMMIAKYCIQDCALVNKLLHKLKVLENNVAMGNVCHVPLTYLFMRGQGIKIFSLVARECRLFNSLIPVIKGVRMDLATDEVGYEGAIVLPPQEGMYLDDPITVFDFESLYPSSMISRNISHDALVIDSTYRAAAEAENNGVTFFDITFDEYEGKGDKKRIKGKKTCTFAQFPDGKKGIVPSILQMLLTQRKNTRKKIEYKTLQPQNISGLLTTSEKDATYSVLDVDTQKTTVFAIADVTDVADTFDDSEKAVLDARQLAYKVTANSLYGQTGSRTSPIYMLEVAACTTANGREMIMLAKDFMETNHNAHVIYGDTDSIFCKFPNEGKKGKEALPLAIATGQKAAKEIKPVLPLSQNLAYEKTLWPFILFSKKRYVGNLYEDDANKEPKQKSMGIVLKRRDNAPIVKYIYGGIIDILMSGGTLQEATHFLKASLGDLVQGRVPLSQLVISKTLKGNYKDPMKIAHKVLAERIGERDPGNKPLVNDRIPFIYIKLPSQSVSKLQGDRIEHPDYIRDNPETMAPDYQFYITNQLLKPISQLFALCVTCLEGYTFPPGYWEQIDAELEGTVMYADEKKRKTRVSNMKMKEVKQILFEPFIAEAESNASPTQRKKPRSRANASIETIAEANNGVYFIMTIDAEQKKRGSIYDCTVTINPSTQDPIEVLRIEKTYNGKKVAALRMAAMEAVMRIHESDDLRDKAILISSPDKTFTRTWKAAIALAASSTDTMSSVKSSLDDGQLREQLELNAFQGLVHARSSLNYVIQ